MPIPRPRDWILIECATHYRVQPRVSYAMAERQKGKPRWIKEIAWRAQNRLHARFKTLKGRLMHHNKVKVAVARELTAFIWELGVKIQTNTAR